MSRSSTGALRQASSASAAAAALPFDRLGVLDQPLGRVGPAVEQHVFDQLLQLRLDLLVHRELPGVDDAHVQAGLDRVVQERRVHRLADDVVAAERERHVRHAAGDVRAGAGCLDPRDRLDELTA